jgi:ribosomal protein S20
MANRVQLTIGADDEATVVLRKVQAELGRLGVSADKADRSISKATQATSSFSGAVQGAQRVLATLGVALGVAEMIRFAKASLDAADNLNDLAQKTGVAAQELQVLGVVAEQSGLRADDLNGVFSRLSKALEELRAGNEDTAASFAAIGLSAKDFEGLSLDQVLIKIAKAQAQYADGSGKSAVMMQLLGRSGADLLPTLNAIADDAVPNVRDELERTGALIRDDTIKAADALNDRLTLLKATAMGWTANGLISWLDRVSLLTSQWRRDLEWISNLRPPEWLGRFLGADPQIAGQLDALADQAARRMLGVKDGPASFSAVAPTAEEEAAKARAAARPTVKPPPKSSGTRLKQVRDDAEREARERAQALDAVMRAEAELDELRGKGIFAATEATRIWAREYENNLRKIGASQAEIDSKVAAALATRFDADEYADAAQRAEQAFNELATDRLRIQQQADRGLISQEEAERRILALERERIPALNNIADAMAAIAARLGDPALIDAAERLKVEIGGLGVEIDTSAVAMSNLGDSIQSALTADLSQFLGDTVNEVEGLGDAFVRLAISVASSIQRIVAELVAARIVGSIAGALFGGGGGVSNVAVSAAQAGASAMRFATGGAVYGPGTGTSDSILARLSHGEYVINAAAVRRIGLAQLDAMNFGMARAYVPRVPRFASGGLVSAPALSAGGATDVVELRLVDEMLEARVLDTLGSGEGRRVQVRNLSRDARKSGRALDR